MIENTGPKSGLHDHRCRCPCTCGHKGQCGFCRARANDLKPQPTLNIDRAQLQQLGKDTTNGS